METTQQTLLGPLKIALPRTDLLDVGCGPNKVAGAFGVDIHPYPGVDQVVNVNQTPWALPSGRFQFIVVRHVIEHVENLVGFMSELHRVAKPGAHIYFETPHFSSINSWSDPTHLRHLSSRWYQGFLPGEYLAAQAGAFRLVNSTVTFRKSFRSKIGALIAGTRGIDKWEKSSAFSFPGSDIVTVLEVVK